MPTSHAQVQQMKAAITTAAAAFGDLCKKQGRGELADDLGSLTGRMNGGVFRLVVMGEIKKGKSSFINAMLGMGDLLPTDTDIATSTVYKIIYGPEKKIKVFFLPDLETGRVPEPETVAESQITEYGTEKGNPGNIKKVDFIAVEYPAELLKTGLVIVDTPGVGGLYKAHQGITWKYAPNADAVFFVLDSIESVISDDEIKFLQVLTEKITDRVYFVQTKKDKAGIEQWQSWEKRNKELLLAKLPRFTEENLRYFPISSKVKQNGDKMKVAKLVEDSGYPAVLDFLENQLIAEKDMLLCHEAAGMLLSKVAVLRGEVAGQLQVFQAESREKLTKLDQQLQTTRMELVEWERTVFQEKQQAFSDQFREMKQDVYDKLNDILDPGTPELTQFLDGLRSGNVAASAMNTEISNYQQKWIAVCSEQGSRELTDFNQRLMASLLELCNSMETHVDVNQFTSRMSGAVSHNWSDGVGRCQSLNLTHSKFDTARNLSMGASFAVGAAFAIGNLVPGLGFLTGALALAAVAGIGGKASYDSMEAKRKEEALAKTERVLRETIAAIRKRALQDFGHLATECEKIFATCSSWPSRQPVTSTIVRLARLPRPRIRLPLR